MLECTDAWIILVSKELIAFIAPSSSSTQERGEWQASVARKKSACLMEVSVAGRFYGKIPRNPGGTEHAQTVCTRLFFLCPRTRAWERGYLEECSLLVDY